ncbi:flagellar biosynthesis protein FlhB [Larsenimonas rhizosphaerae]|uniref:Flagellar biosynthetic protein FlhB n=1 Tax=Larsenimonas rhizosphaerae TaxID=2944682 RepID=A0AA41ZK42_9GAMM|nr:flagellar biosynthesis protein FlhB [Larsenimonas rhizosphaerae]MCM2130388.1 flagellar biosynthesis protein FlhB [Larsenimonas rhizosphaerae]MCX2523093.1 flagellar biosynthesis protein FlhB [Larsenimonas rhizosphaerae]
MADDSDQEKTEEPTPRKLEKAREDGQVARSRELSTFMMLLIGVGTFWIMAGWFGEQMTSVMGQGFRFGREEAFDTSRLFIHMVNLLEAAALGIAPMMLVLTITALIAPAMLGGWLFSTKSLTPDLKKLDPIKGLKRVFSTQALAELAKGIAKAVLVGAITSGFIYFFLGQLLGLANESGFSGIAHSMKLILLCCTLIVMGFLIVVGIDVPYQIWSHNKKLRMSLDDIKKEHKESEGDPQIKARIRQQQQAMARNRMMSKVPTADVIVTNPTHYAVALAYSDDMGAPTVVAKGTDHIAEKIKELGRENRVPVLEAPPLARALHYHVDLDREIPGQLYAAVAEVLAWVYQLKRYKSEGGDRPGQPTNLPVPVDMDIPSITKGDDAP